MTVIKKDLVVPYTAKEMYDLVTDIAHYPDFLPWCKGASIRNQTQYRIDAALRIEKFKFDFAFGLTYQLQNPNRMIEIFVMQNRVFRSIKAFWRFEDAPARTSPGASASPNAASAGSTGKGSSRFGLELDYEFASTLLGWTLTPLIKNEVNKALKEFSDRAEKVYGVRR